MALKIYNEVDMDTLTEEEKNIFGKYRNNYDLYCAYKNRNEDMSEEETKILIFKKSKITDSNKSLILFHFNNIREKQKDKAFINLYDQGKCYDKYCSYMENTNVKNYDYEELERIVFKGTNVAHINRSTIIATFKEIREKNNSRALPINFIEKNNILDYYKNINGLFEIDVPASQDKTIQEIIDKSFLIPENETEDILKYIDKMVSEKVSKQVSEKIDTVFKDKFKEYIGNYSKIFGKNQDYDFEEMISPKFKDLKIDQLINISKSSSKQQNEHDEYNIWNVMKENSKYESILNHLNEENTDFEQFEVTSDLAEFIEKIRITQTALAQKTGISRGTIITILKNPNSMSLNNAYRISRVLGIPIEDLFKYTEKIEIDDI